MWSILRFNIDFFKIKINHNVAEFLLNTNKKFCEVSIIISQDSNFEREDVD